MKLKVYNAKIDFKKKLSIVTVHGRFQPPLHINHWNYIAPAFKLAKKVTILITNPYIDEREVKQTNHRHKPENNPFTYTQRVKIFKQFFGKMGIKNSRYEFKPFNITDHRAWRKLNKSTPNLVNTYGAWSRAKLRKFRKLGFQVIHSSQHKAMDISGTKIRQMLNLSLSIRDKKRRLVKIGYMPQALEGLFSVLKLKNEK